MKRLASLILSMMFIGLLSTQTEGQRGCEVGVTLETKDSVHILTAEARGTAPFKFEWSNGAIGESIRVVNEGLYCVTLTDSDGCQSRACALIKEQGNEPCEVVIEVRRTRVDSIVTLSAQTKNTGSNLKYEWSTGETTQNINVNVTVAGNYCVTITDDEGCMARDCFEIKGETDRCAVRIKADRDLQGNVILIAYPTGADPFKFEWSNGETTQRIAVKGEGEYCVLVTDANGCESKACIDFGPVRDKCAVRISQSRKDSNGITVLTAFPTGQAPFKFEWNTGETTQRIAVDSAGVYCVTITDSTGCVARNCITIRKDTGSSCRAFIKARRDSSGIHLTGHMRGQAPFTYEWSTGETTKGITIDSSGEYCVKITDAAGCTAGACFKIRKNIDSGKRDSCAVRIQEITDRGTGEIILVAQAVGSGKISYEWSTGETGEKIKAPKSGTYCVTIKDEEGCVSRACIDVRKIGGNGPSNFKIFPNPMVDVLYVSWESDQTQDIEYSITSVRGQVELRGKWNETGDATQRIDVNGLQSGLYTLTLVTSDGTKNFRLTKQ